MKPVNNIVELMYMPIAQVPTPPSKVEYTLNKCDWVFGEMSFMSKIVLRFHGLLPPPLPLPPENDSTI